MGRPIIYDRDLATKLFEQGLSYGQIAKQMGLKPGTVRHLVPKEMRQSRWAERTAKWKARRDEASRLFEEGRTGSEIAQRLGLKSDYVSYFIPGKLRDRQLRRFESLHSKMYRLREKGWAYPEIGKKFGMSSENARSHVVYYAKVKYLPVP